MPKLPNAEQAYVEQSKLDGYLLDPDHRVGAPKLRFLESFGFSRAEPEKVCAALIAHGGAHEASVISTRFGVKYEVDGPLLTPTGEAPWVRTIWLIGDGDARPRLISMKPLRKRP